ncbi:sensor histidine kinase [Propionibacteriaceae bacterium G1746]
MTSTLALLPRAGRFARHAGSRLTERLQPFLDASPVDRRRDTPWAVRLAALGVAAVVVAAGPQLNQLTNVDPLMVEAMAHSMPAQVVTMLLALAVAMSWWLPGLALVLIGATMALSSLVVGIAATPVIFGDVRLVPAVLLLAAWPWWWRLLVPATKHQAGRRLLDDHQRSWVVPVLALTGVAYAYWRGMGSMWGVADNPRMDSWVNMLFLMPLLAIVMPRVALAGTLLVVVGASGVPTAPSSHNPGLAGFHAWPEMATVVLIMVAAVAHHRHRWVAWLGWGSVVALHLALYLNWGAIYRLDPVTVKDGRGLRGASAWYDLFLKLWPSYVLHAMVLAASLFICWHISRSVALKKRSTVLTTREAQVSERARLARDLHDVVAHHVSLIAVRAETAPYTHPTLDAPGRALLADIATDARQALDELRGVLGLLRRSDLEGGDAGALTAETAPLPGGGDLVPLVERNIAAGMTISLADQRGPYTELVYASSRGHVIYRVLQEALTNARRHAPDEPVLVILSDEAPQLVVTNTLPASPGRATQGAGTGIIGMRERVEALGGRLEVTRDNEFRVEVNL